MACEAPAIAIVRCERARSAMKWWRAGGMMRSSSPNRNQDGTSFHSGRSPDGSVSASCVAGRCVAAISAACARVDVLAEHVVEAVRSDEKSVVPSLRGTGRTVDSPSMLPGNMVASPKQVSPASGANPLT